MKKNAFFEKPAPMTPVDRVASRVILGGEIYSPNKIVLTGDSDFPLKTRRPNKAELGTDSFSDLSGRSFGRMVVVGISAEKTGKWVVKCSCGRYSLRSAKAIKNKNNECDRCEHCRHQVYLKKDEFYRRTGRELDMELRLR